MDSFECGGPDGVEPTATLRYRPDVEQPVWVEPIEQGDRRAVGLLDEWRLEPGDGDWKGHVLYLHRCDGRWVPTTAWFPSACITLDLNAAAAARRPATLRDLRGDDTQVDREPDDLAEAIDIRGTGLH